jgi:CRP/FNR family transcriptional regulator, cyclic AMP receptor protein
MPSDAPEVDDFLALLDPADREALARRGHRRRFGAGERLLRQGEEGDSVLLLRSGRVKVSCTTHEGRECVLHFRGPGDLVGELAVLDGRPRSSSVTAIEPVEALVLPGSEFRSLLEKAPGIAVSLLRMLSRRFRDSDLKRIEFGASDTVGRLAARLVELTERYGEPERGGLRIALPISQEELAGWTGASRAGLAGALRTLRDLGWIETERRRITVRDLEALRARAA